MKTYRIAVGAAFAASLALAVASTDAQAGKGRPARARAELTNTAVDEDASGRVDVRHFPAVGRREERSWLRFKLRHLGENATFTLWMDDPSTPEDTSLVDTGIALTTNDRGGDNHRIDTKHGGTLPFGGTLVTLAGMNFELRNADGVAVLNGTLPAVQ